MSVIADRPPRSDGDTVWLRRYHRSEAAPVTLVCFPHAGGSASFFFPLSRALAPGIEVLAVQYPGRQDRRTEPVIERVEPLADRVHEALAGWTGRRLVLFGHSMGATVAFEVARRLAVPPELLTASARRAPSLATPGSVHRRDDAGVVAELSRLGGTAATLFRDPELVAAVLPAVRGDYAAVESYQCGPELTVGCPILALVGASDPVTSREQAEAWRGHTSADFRTRVVAGGHFYLEGWSAPVVGLIRETLTSLGASDGGPAARL